LLTVNIVNYYFLTFLATRELNVQGKQEIAHDVAVIIEFKNRIAKVNGRFGAREGYF
jgi:hypothetical protein